MRVNLTTLVMILILITNAVCGQALPNADQSKKSEIVFSQGMTWNEIKQKAKQENKYLFLDCYTTWCGPCREMDKI